MFRREVIFSLLIPKERGEDEKKKEITPEIIKTHIAAAETFFSTLGGIKRLGFFSSLFFPAQNHISFEIVLKNGLISFYVALPPKLKDFVEQQLHAQYPMISIEEVSDYNMFSPQGKTKGAFLVFRKHPFLPLKTYKKFDNDPLNALANALSKCQKDEGAAMQILLHPAKKGWNKAGLRVARAMRKGKKFFYAMRQGERGAFLRFFFKFMEDVTTSSKQHEQEEQKTYKQHLTPLEEELMKSIEEKSSKAGFEVNIRVVACASKERVSILLDNITRAFNEFSIYEYGNGLKPRLPFNFFSFINDFIFRRFGRPYGMILNTEELASIFHMPGPWIETPNIEWLHARKLAAPVNLPSEGLLLGHNVFRGVSREVRFTRDDRRRHLYIIGKSGTGKSWLLANLARQDIQNGEGVCVVDPHGDLIEDVAQGIPESRLDDVIYFDPSDMDRPVGLNMLEAKSPEERDFAVQEMIAIFYKLFPPEIIGPMFEHNMRNVMLTLMSDMENPGTLAEIPRMFTDNEFQKEWVAKVKDPVVRVFWEKEMAKTSDFHKSEMLGYLISKVGRFVENEMMRNIIGQSRSGFNIREIMDNRKILLVNLPKGKMGEVNSGLLGLIIVSKLQMAALSRANLPQEQRHDFYLYIDEFQNFITDSISTILAEARKYRLCLTLAHQYLGQLAHGSVGSDKTADTKIRDAVLGTVGTMMAFKIGIEDAELIAKEFAPVVTEYDLVNIQAFNAYVKLLYQNQTTRPFNISIPPLAPGNPRVSQAVRELSRLKYGRPKELVDAEIMERAQLGVTEKNWTGVEKTL